jgi:hypothetical protein
MSVMHPPCYEFADNRQIPLALAGMFSTQPLDLRFQYGDGFALRGNGFALGAGLHAYSSTMLHVCTHACLHVYKYTYTHIRLCTYMVGCMYTILHVDMLECQQ